MDSEGGGGTHGGARVQSEGSWHDMHGPPEPKVPIRGPLCAIPHQSLRPEHIVPKIVVCCSLQLLSGAWGHRLAGIGIQQHIATVGH